jgi:hypothetical protein
MSVTRYKDGDVTVTLSGDLEAWVKRALTASNGAVVREMQAEAEAVASQARADWYGPNGVNKQTGLSGDIVVVTTVTPDSVTVGLGSSDVRMGKSKRGKMVNIALFVHRPGPLSLVARMVTKGEWWAWQKAGKPVGKSGTRGGGRYGTVADWTIYESNDEASDGARLMGEFVRKPMTARVRRLPDALREAILARVK